MMHLKPKQLITSLFAGALLAFVFALLLHLVPAWVLLSTGPLLCLHVVGFLVGILSVEILARVLGNRNIDALLSVLAMLAGAGLFDGLAIVFWPSLYGHSNSSEALLRCATVILFAIGTFSIAAFIRLKDGEQPYF